MGIAVTISAQFINENRQNKSRIRASLSYVKIELEDNLQVIDNMLEAINKNKKGYLFFREHSHELNTFHKDTLFTYLNDAVHSGPMQIKHAFEVLKSNAHSAVIDNKIILSIADCCEICEEAQNEWRNYDSNTLAMTEQVMAETPFWGFNKVGPLQIFNILKRNKTFKSRCNSLYELKAFAWLAEEFKTKTKDNINLIDRLLLKNSFNDTE